MKVKKQVAALPIRFDMRGLTRVMLVTSRETRRLVIPKGWPWAGVDDYRAAAEEAREEAGIIGKIEKRPIGTYTYEKRLARKSVTVRVRVFLLVVESELEDWPECKQRERMWLTLRQAAKAVEEPELAELILGLRSRREQAAA